jgi:hypothetical protein
MTKNWKGLYCIQLQLYPLIVFRGPCTNIYVFLRSQSFKVSGYVWYFLGIEASEIQAF